MLRAAGFDLTDEGIAQARGKLPRLTKAQRAESHRRHDAVQAGRWRAGPD
jgi:hypothetical protein